MLLRLTPNQKAALLTAAAAIAIAVGTCTINVLTETLARQAPVTQPALQEHSP